MPELFSRRSNRLPGYNYSSNGAYYITICANNRKCLFGEIKYAKCVGAGLVPARNDTLRRIKLSTIGKIINDEWNDIPNQYKNIYVDEYVIMPNHFHGIIMIGDGENNRAATRAAPTHLGRIIGSFKSRCTVNHLKCIRKYNLDISTKIWQRNYHDHIIRNDKSLNKIRKYIRNNPLTWNSDIENPDRIIK